MKDEKDNFATSLYSMSMNMIACMMPLPILHRSKYLFHYVSPDVSHEFYRKLYPNIVRDIKVSS